MSTPHHPGIQLKVIINCPEGSVCNSFVVVFVSIVTMDQTGCSEAKKNSVKLTRKKKQETKRALEFSRMNPGNFGCYKCANLSHKI